MREAIKQALGRAGLLPYARAARAGALAARAAAGTAAREALHPDAAASPRDELDNAHLRLLMAFLLAPDSNCIDIGCHEGAILADMVQFAPEGRHLAFEPLAHLHERLVERFRGQPGVEVHNVALANRAGTATFTHVKDLPGYSGFRRRTYPIEPEVEEVEVAVDRLDDVLPPGYVPTLIKIDVEGAELDVLAGGIETISRHKPVIVFEHGLGAADHYGTSPRDVHKLLCAEAGLRIFDLDGNGPYDIDQFDAAFHANDRWNWVAHR